MKEMDTESPDPSSFYNRQHGRLHTVFQLSEHHSLPGTSGTTPMMATNLVKREERKSGCENNGASRSTLPPFEETNTAAYKDTHSLSISTQDMGSPLRKTSGFTATSPTRRSSACGFLRKGELDLRTSCSPSSSLQEILGSSPSKTPQFHARDNENKVLFDHSGIVSKPETSSLVSSLSLSGAGPSAKKDQPTVGNSQPKKPLPKYVHRPKSKIEDIVRNLRVQKSLTDDTFSFTKPDISSTSPSSERTARDILDQSISGKTNHDCLQDKKECASECVSDRCINNEGTTDKSVPTLSSDKCCLPRTSPIKSACVNRDGHERVNLCVETGAVDKKAHDTTSAKEANNLTKPTRTEPGHTAATKVSRKEDCNEGRCEEGTKAVLEETGISSEPKDQSKVEETARKCLNESSQKSAGSSSGKVSPSLTGDSPLSVTGSRDSSSKSISSSGKVSPSLTGDSPLSVTGSRDSSSKSISSSGKVSPSLTGDSPLSVTGSQDASSKSISSSGKVSPSLTGDSPPSVTGSQDASSKSISKTCSRKSNDLNVRSSNRETKAASSKIDLNGQLSLQDGHENTVGIGSPSSRRKHQSKKHVHSVPNKKPVSAKSDCEVSNVVGQTNSSKPSKTDSSIKSRTPSSRNDKGKHTKSKIVSGNGEKKQLKSESSTKAPSSFASKSTVQETVNLKTCNKVPDGKSKKSDLPIANETKVQKYNSLFPDYLEDISSESDFDDDRVGESSKPINVFATSCLGDELEDISSAPDSMDEDSATAFDMADKLKKQSEIYDAKRQGDELNNSGSGKDSSSLHKSNITVGDKDFQHNRTSSSSKTDLSSLSSDVQSLSLQDSIISEDSCEDSRVKCVQLLKELMLTADDVGVKVCSNRNSTSLQPCLPCRLPLTKVSQALENYSKTSKSSCRTPETPGDMIKPLNMPEISEKESTPDVSESPDIVTLSGMVSEVVDSTDTAGTLADVTEMPCSIAEPSTPVIPLSREGSSDIADASVYFNGITDSSERTGILEDPFVAPNTVPNISETPATLTDLSEITDVLADLSESSDPLMELSETSNSLVELRESADALAVLPAISVALDCSSEISSSLADLPVTTDSLENLSGTDNIHPSLPGISDSLGCTSEISSVIEDLREATNSLDSQPDETINVLPLLPEMSDTLDSSCEAVNILTNLPETVDPLDNTPGITDVLSVLPKISSTVADLSETAHSFPVSSKGTDCFSDKSPTGDISIDSSKADGITEEPETTAASNNNSETRSPFIESSSETTAASNDSSETRNPEEPETMAASNNNSETRSPFIESSSETNTVNDSSTSGAEVTKSKDSTDIAINISLPLDSLLELPKPAYPVLEEEHKEDETELSSASLHEEVSDGISRVHNKESRLLGILSLASDIENVDHGSPTKLKTPMEICDVSPDTKAVVPPEVNNVPPEASATSSDSLLSSDKTNQSRVVSPSNKFLFQIGKEHHMKLDDGQKLFACDICSGVYQRAFSLKRHYLRSHINYRYLTERDISNCGILTGDKMALQSENNTKIRMQNSKITSVSDSESSRDVPVSSTFIDDEVSGLLQDNTRVLSESEVVAKETTSNKTEKPDINEVENVKTVGALNVLSNPTGLYRCHTCGECFEEKSALKVHLKNHPIPLSVGPSGESKSFSCTRCNATFSHKNNYLRHCASLAHNKQPVIVASGSKKAFLCLYCNKEFTSVAIRKRHQSRIHQNQKKLKNRRRPQHACPFCPKSKKFRDLSLVMKHCLSEHSDDYHVCTTCPERFPSKQILNEHVKEEHTKLKTKSVKVEPPVNNAVDIKSPGKEIMEPKGADSVISNTGIEQEEVNQLENVPLLERKKKLPVNREGNKEQQVPTENNFRYKCSVCQKMFTNYVNLSRHNRLAHRTVSSSKKSKNSSQSSSCTDTLSSPSDGSRSQSPLVTSFVPVNVKKSLPKQSQATPRLAQNTQSNSRLEGTVDERTMDPETLFYSRLSCNIRDNLLNHLDGKLHSQGSADQCEESVCASLEVDSREESTSQDSNVISMSSLSNTNELLEDDKTNKIDSKERSLKYKTGGNTVHKVFWEKYNFPKNYDGRGGGLTSYIKDMSHLDIHTQLTMRQNLQRMNSNSSDSSEDMPLSRMVRSEASGKDNVINFPAELCLIENVSNKQKSQNSKASSLTSKLTRESRRVTRRTSELEQKEKEAALEREAKSNSSSRRASTEDSDSNTVVLSGEWVRPRSYICAACSARFADLWDLEDHKYSVHPNVWCTHYEFDETSVFGNAGGEDGSSTAPPSLPVDLCPRYLLSDGALQAAKIIPVTVASDSKCTKCGRSFNTLPDLHRHMLECGGDTTWMLTMLVTSPGANNRRNRKWRPFGSRRRRQQGRRGMKRNIPSTPVKIPHYRPRHRGNDSDSIQRMIANLPPKRSTRRVIQFSEDEIKTRSQGTIHSVPFVPNLTRPTYKSGICRSSYGRIISSPDRKHSQALKKRAVSIASGAGSSQRAKARKFLRSQSEVTVARAQAPVPLDLYTAGPSTSKGVLRRSTGNIPNSSREGAKGGRVARRNKNASANSSVSSSPLTVVEDKVSLPGSKALVVSRGRSIKRLTVSSEVRSLSTGPDTIMARITRNVKRSLSLDQAKVTTTFQQDSIAGLSGGEIELKGKVLKALDNVKGKVARSTTSSSEVSKLGERRSKHFASRVIETGMTIPRDNSTVLSAVRLAILEKSTSITQGMFEVCKTSSTSALRRQTRGHIKVSLEESMIAGSDGVVDNPIQCGNCGIKFPNPSACERHKKKCVVNTDHQLCHHCGKSFAYTTHFWKHIKSCRSLLHAVSGNIAHNQSIALKPAVPLKDVGKKSTVPKRSISNSPARRKSSKTSDGNLKVNPSFSDTDDRMPALEKVLPIVDTKRVTRSKKSGDLSDIPVLSPVSDPLVLAEGEGSSIIEEYSKRNNRKGKTIRSVSESRLVEMNRSEVLSKENISDMETLSFDDKDQNPNTVKRSRSLTNRSLKLSVADGRLHKGTKKESPKRKNRNLSKNYEIPISKLEAQFAEVVNIIDDSQESTSESTAESQDKDDMDSIVIGTKVGKGRGNVGVDTATVNKVTGELETVTHMKKVGNTINIKHQQTCAVSNESTFLKLLPSGKPMLKDRTTSVKTRCRSVPETSKLGQNSENSSANNALDSNVSVGNVRRRRSMSKSLKIEFQALPAPTEYIQPAKLSSQKSEAGNSSIQEPRRNTKRRSSLMKPESPRKENFVSSHPRSKSETKVGETSDVESHQLIKTFQNIDCLKENSVINSQGRRRRSCTAVIESESQPPSADSSRSEKMESPDNFGSSTEDSLNTDIQEKVVRHNKARFSNPKVDISQSHYSPNEVVSSSLGKQDGRRSRSRSSRSSLQILDGSLSSEATEFDESSVEYPQGDLMNSVSSKTSRKRSPTKAAKADLAVLNGFSSVEYSNEQSFESSTEESVDGSLKEENKKHRNRAKKLEFILSETSQESSEIHEVADYVQESMQNKRIQRRKVIKNASLNVKTTDVVQLSKDTLLGTTETAQFNEESTQDDPLNNSPTKRQRRKHNRKATKVQLEACDILQYSEFTEPEESQDLFQNHEYVEDINQNSDAVFGKKKIKRLTRPITTGLEVSNLPNSSKSDTELNILQSNKSLGSVIELPVSNTSQSSVCNEHYKSETSDSEADPSLSVRLDGRKVQVKNSKTELQSAQISQSSEWIQLEDNPANNECAQVQRKQNRSRSKGGKAKQQVSNVEAVDVSELEPISRIDRDCKEKVLNGTVKQKTRRRIQPKVSEIELISNTSLSSEYTEAEELKEMHNVGEYLDDMAVSSNRTSKKKCHPTLGTGHSRNTNTKMKELHQLNEVNFDNGNLKSRKTNNRKSSVYIENEKPFQICASLQDMGNSSPEIKKRNRSRTKSPKISQFSGTTELEDQSSLESSLMDEFLEKDSTHVQEMAKSQTSQNDLTTCNTSQILDASQSEKLGKKQNIIESQTKSAELNVLQSPDVVSGKLKKGKKQSRPRNLESELNMSGISTSPEVSLYLQNNESLNHDLQSEMVEKQNFGYSRDKTMAGNDKVELVTSGAQKKIKKVRGQNKLFTSQLKPSNIMKLSLQHESDNLQDLVNSKLQGKKKKGKSQTNAPGLDLQSDKTSSQLDPGKLLGEAEVNDILNSYLIKRQNEAESQLNTVLMSEMNGGGLPFQILTAKKPHTVEMSHMNEGRKSGLTVVHDKAENVFKCKSKIRKSVLQSREIQMVPHLGQEPLEMIHHLDSHRNEFTGSPGLEKKRKKKKYRSRTKCVNAKFQIQEIDVDLGSSNLSQPLALDEIIQPIAFQEDDEENGGMQKETPIKKKLPKFKLQMLGTSLVIQHAENGQLLKTSEVSQITGTVHDEILGSTTFIKKRNKSQSKAVKSGPLMQNANELESLPINTESSAGMVKERIESQINPENCEPNMITPVENTQPVDLEKLSREERFAASMDEIFKCVLGEESSEVVVPVKKKNTRKSQEKKFATDESMLETIEAVVRGSIEMSENCDRNEDKNTLPTDFTHIAENMENSDVQMSRISLEKPVINSEIPDVLSVAVDAIQASLEKLKSDVGSINNKEILRDPVKSQRRSSSENFRRRRQNSMEKGRKRKRRKSSSSAEQIMHSSDEDSLSIAELRSLNQQGVGKIMNIGVEPVHEITDCSQQSSYLNKIADLERIHKEPNETSSSLDSSHPRKSRSTKKIKARAQAVADELGDKVTEILESVVFGKNDEVDTEPFSFMEYVENGVFVDEDTLPISKFGDPVFMKQFRRQRELFENKKNTSNDLNSEADKDQISTMSRDVVPNNLPLQITSGKELSNVVDDTEGKRSDEAAVGVDSICLNDKEISDGFIGKSLRRCRKREETTVPVFGRERSARITRWNLSYEEMYTSSDVGSETDSQEFDMTAPEDTNDMLAREPPRRTLPPRKSRPSSSGRNRRSNIRKSKNLKLHWASAKYRKMRSKRKRKTGSRGTDAKNETCLASNMNFTSEDPVENRPENGLEITKSVESHLEDVVEKEISEDPTVMEESTVRQSSDNSITEKENVLTEKKSNIHNSDCNIPVEKIENSKDLSEASRKEMVVSISENSKDLLKASGKERAVSIRENSKDLLETAGKEMVVSISENSKDLLEASGKERVASISLDVEVADIQPNVQINSSTDESATELVNPVELKENNETGSSSLGISSPFCSNLENKSKEKRSVAKYYCSSCEKNFATARNLRKHKETLFHLLQEKKRSSEDASNSLATGTEDSVEEVENVCCATDQTSHEVLALVDGVNHIIGEAEQSLDSELITDNNRMEPESISKPDLVQQGSEVIVSNENMKGNQCEKDYQLHPVESEVLNTDRDSKRRRISSRKKDSNVDSVTSNKTTKVIKTNYETVTVSGSLGSSVSHQDDNVASEPLSSDGKYWTEDCIKEVENVCCATDQTSHEVLALVDGVNHVIGEAEQSLDSELITDNNRMELKSISKPDLVQEVSEVIVSNVNMKGNQCGKDDQLHPVESEVLNTDRDSKRRRVSSRKKNSNVDSMTSNKATKVIKTNYETVAVSGSFGSIVSHQDDTVASEPLSSDGKYQTEDCVEEVENVCCATDQTSHEILALVDGVNHVIGEAEQSLDSELITDNNRMEPESISKPGLVQEVSEVIVSNVNMKGNQCGKDDQLHPVESEVLNTDRDSKRRRISSRKKNSNVDSMTSNKTKDIETNDETVIVSCSFGSSVCHQDDTAALEPLPSDGKYRTEDCVEEVENVCCATDQTSHEVLALVDGVNHVIGEAEQSLDSELITDNNRMELKSISKPDLVQEGSEVIVINANMKGDQCGKDHELHPVESEVLNTDRKSKRRWISSRRKDSNVDSMTSNKTTKDIETSDETVIVSGSLGSNVSHQDDTVASEPLSSDGKCLLVNSSYVGGTSDENQIEKCATQELPAEPEPLDQTDKSLETLSIVDTSIASSCKAIPGDLTGVSLGWSLSEESMAANDLALLTEESTPINTALADNYETFSSELVTQFSSVPSAPLEAESLDPEQIQLGDQPLNPPAEQICWTDNLQNKEGEWCQDIVAKDTDLTGQQDQQPQEEQQTTSSTQPVTITWTNGDSSQKEAWGDLEKLPEANWSEQQRANSTQWTEQNQPEIASWPSVEQPALENSNWTNNGDQQQPWPNAVNWPAPDGWIGEPPRTWLWPSGNNTVEWGQQQNQAESTVCPWPNDPDSAQFYNQMEGNASLGTIMDTVNQVLHQEVLPPQSTSGSSEYPLYSYSEDAAPSPAAPLASLRELQKAMGATDEEMVILQRLGERTLESNWPLENAEIIDLDKHQQGDAPTPPPPPPPPSVDPGAQKSNSDSDSAPAVKTPPPASTSTPRKRNLPLRMVLGRNGRPKEYSPARDTSLMHEYQDKEMVCPLCHRFFLGLTALQTHVSSTHNQDETGKTQRVANRSRKTFSSLLSASPNEPGANSPRVLCPVCRELLQDEASLVRHREEMHNPCASSDADAKDPSQLDDNSKASSEGGGGEEPGAEGLKIKMTTALGDLFDRALSNLLEKGRLAGAAKDGASLNSLSLLQMTIKRSAGLDKKGSEGEAQPSTSRHNAKKLLGRRRNSGSEGKAPEVDRPFACPVCDDRFVILSTRNRHIARAHNNRLTAVEDRSSVSSPMSTMASTDDQSEEPTLDELDSAWREASPADWSVEPTEGDSEAGSFLCSDCGINFETPQDVLQHRKLEHSGRSEAVKDKLGTQEPATAQGSGEHIKSIEDSICLGKFQKMSQILSSVTKHLSEANEAKLKTVEARNDSGTSSLSNEESSSQTAERISSQEQLLQNNKTVNVDVSTQLIKDLSTSKESISDSGNDMSTVSDDPLSNLPESSKNDSNLKEMDGICGGKVVELSSSIEIPILSHIHESISAAVNEKLDKDADIMVSRVEKSLTTSTMKDNSAAKCTAAEKTIKGTGKVGRGRSSARSLEKQMELCEDGTTIRAKAEAALRELNSRKNRSNTNPASKWGLKFTVSDSPKEKPPKKDGEGAQSDYPKKSATTDRFNFPLVRKLPVGSTRFASLAEKKKKVTNVSSVKKVMPVAEEDKLLGVSLESEVTKPQATMSFDVYEFEDEDSVPVGELGFRPLHQRSSDERPKDIEGTDKSGENDSKSAMSDHTGEQQENDQDKTLKNNEELATEVAAEILEPRYDGSKSDQQAVPAEGGHHHQEPSHDVEKKEGKHEKSKESSKHKRSKKSSHEKVRRQSCHDEYLFGEHKIKSNEDCHKSEYVPSDYINSEEDNDTTIKKSRKERGKKEHRKKKSHKKSEEHVNLSTEHSQKRKCEKDSSVKKQSKFKKSSESNDLEGMTCSKSAPVEGGDSVSKKESRKHSKKRRLPSENSSDETSDVTLHESRRRTSSKHEHLKKRHKKRKHRYSMSSVSGFIEKHKTNYDSDDDNSLILSAKEVSSGRRYFVDDDDDETTNCSSDRGEDSSEQTKRAAARRRRTKSDLLISVFAKSKRNCLMNNSALRSKSFLTISSKDRDQTLSSSDESDVCDKRRSLNSSGNKNRTVSSSEVI